MGELVSIIIPAHNVERFIEQTCASVLQQSHSNIEIIVVDDGSTDGTWQTIQNIAARDARVSSIQTANVGVSAARNMALAKCRGDFVAPIDGDDVWHWDKLARQLQLMREGGEKVGVVYCWSRGIDERNRIILPAWNDSAAAGNVLRDIVIRGIAGNGSTALIRKKFIDAVGGYDEGLTLSEDWKFYTELAGVCEFAVVPKFLTGYRLRDDSASSNVRELELAIGQITTWIRNKWPSLSDDVFRERSYVVDTYLAVLAIRQRDFSYAMRLLKQAAKGAPEKILTKSYTELWALLLIHAAGLRVYRWDFWRRPPYLFERADAVS